jgi:hypothetical protein
MVFDFWFIGKSVMSSHCPQKKTKKLTIRVTSNRRAQYQSAKQVVIDSINYLFTLSLPRGSSSNTGPSALLPIS